MAQGRRRAEDRGDGSRAGGPVHRRDAAAGRAGDRRLLRCRGCQLERADDGVVMPTMPLGITLHTWPVTACGGMSIGFGSAVAATEVLARTALDVLTDAGLRTDARSDFERR